MNFKANISVKSNNKIRERILWIQKDDIIEALSVVSKVKAIKLNYIKTITWDEYIRGVSGKSKSQSRRAILN